MKSNPSHPDSRRPDRTAMRLVSFGIPWAVLSLTLVTIDQPSPENLALLTSILGSGLYTLLLWATRSIWLPRLQNKPIRNAILLGIFNAVVIETLFLVMQETFGAEGVAADSNLLVDLILTMPWYMMMVYTFSRVQQRRRFSGAVVLLLGGLYELGADGLVGQLIGLLSGSSQLLNPGFWLLLGILIYWQFILVYSSLVLAPAWVLEKAPKPAPPNEPVWKDALRPMVWLIPFSAYLLLILMILGKIRGAG